VENHGFFNKDLKGCPKWSQIGTFGATYASHKNVTPGITGLVSLQYQIQFDDFFKTTRWKEYLPRSEWKLKARLINNLMEET